MSTLTLTFPFAKQVATLNVYPDGINVVDAFDVDQDPESRVDASGTVRVPSGRYLELQVNDCSQLEKIFEFDMAAIEGIRFEVGIGRRFVDNDCLSLANMHNLRSLSIRSQDVTDDGLLKLKPLTSLECLNISSCDRIKSIVVGGYGLEGLESMSKLVRLTASWSYLLGDDLKVLKSLTHLQQIDLSQSYNNLDSGMSFLAALPDLQILNLMVSDVSVGGVQMLGESRSLRKLDLYGIKLQDAGLTALAQIPTLEDLILDSTAIRGVSLSSLVQLKRLSVANCKSISMANLEQIGQLTNLEYLSLSGLFKVRDKLIGKLANLQKLHHLDLCWCSEITDAVFVELSKLKSLRSVDLTDADVTQQGVRAFEKMCPDCVLMVNL